MSKSERSSTNAVVEREVLKQRITGLGSSQEPSSSEENFFSSLFRNLGHSSKDIKRNSMTRPRFLPPKDLEEEAKHLREYEEMMALYREKAKTELELEKKLKEKKLSREELLQQNASKWENDILPHWETKKLQYETRALWWDGLPPQLRRDIWLRSNNIVIDEAKFLELARIGQDLRQQLEEVEALENAPLSLRKPSSHSTQPIPHTVSTAPTSPGTTPATTPSPNSSPTTTASSKSVPDTPLPTIPALTPLSDTGETHARMSGDVNWTDSPAKSALVPSGDDGDSAGEATREAPEEQAGDESRPKLGGDETGEDDEKEVKEVKESNDDVEVVEGLREMSSSSGDEKGLAGAETGSGGEEDLHQGEKEGVKEGEEREKKSEDEEEVEREEPTLTEEELQEREEAREEERRQLQTEGMRLLGKESSVHQIMVDLPRTFPALSFFQPDGPFYPDLRKVLEAYSVLHPKIGYVQGMSFIAATLLLHLSPVEAFHCMCNVLSSKLLQVFYSMNIKVMQRVYLAFTMMINTHLPLLAAHLSLHDVPPELYLIDWLLTIFTKSIPIDIATHIVDIYFFEGDYFLFRTALGILKYLQDRLLRENFYGILQTLKHLNDPEVRIDEEELIACIRSVRLSPEETRTLLAKSKSKKL